MSTPVAQTKERYAELGGRAFKMPYDGTSEMHFVEQTPDFFLLKAGEFLISIHPRWGAYLAKSGENDVESGAGLLPECQRWWWRQQRAWVSFDMQNRDTPEPQSLGILARLVLESLDDKCCGVWIPSRGHFLPNNETGKSELKNLSLG
jgi:hypothetical protein